MIEDERTEREKQLDHDADHLGESWYMWGFPRKYVSTRFIQGHEVVVIVANGELGKRLMGVVRTYEDRT